MTPLVAVSTLLVLPAILLAGRSGWLAETRQRRTLWILLTVPVLWAMPWRGVDFLLLKRLALLLALATSVLLACRAAGVGWTRDRRHYREALVALAALAALAYGNFFAFHGSGVFVHWHDVAHYYLGSKYYPELGYRHLYTAMLRAEAENHDNHFKAIEARDLETYQTVHIRRLLRRSDPVKAAFSDERWTDFKRDADVFRQRLDRHYGTVLLDHGFNPTPVWASIGGSLARLVPAGSESGILLLCLLDPLLLLALFVAIGRTFGRETLLLAVIYFCTLFGATFGWTGGAFLRYLWLFAVVVGCCALERRRRGWAGALFALATALRIFPGLLLLPLGLRALVVAWRMKRPTRRDLRLFGAFAATAAGLLLLSLAVDGAGAWRDFTENMQLHVAVLSPNTVGLTEAVAFRDGPQQVTADELAAIAERRHQIHRALLPTVFLPLVLLAWRLALRHRPVACVALALPLLYVGLSLAGYYWCVLLVALLWRRRHPGDIALLFLAEAVPYTLMLFEEREALVFIARGLAMAGALLVLFWADLRREALSWRRPEDTSASENEPK